MISLLICRTLDIAVLLLRDIYEFLMNWLRKWQIDSVIRFGNRLIEIVTVIAVVLKQFDRFFEDF